MNSEMEKDILKVLVTEEELKTRIAELGEELYKRYEGHRPLFLGVLKGSFIFMADLKSYLMAKGAKSISIVTLLDKPSRREKAVEADLSGFVVPDEFVVGYGLDYAQLYRNLPYIGVLKPAVYENT